MKKLLSFAALLLTFVGQMWAYDFSAVASNGDTLYYNIHGTNVEVTYPGMSTNNPWGRHTMPTGDLTIPDTVTHSGQTFFVTSIGEGAFLGCSGLTSVIIDNFVTSIGVGAFQLCTGLTSVTIPNSVTSIGAYAFNTCTGLTSVTIPYFVTSIGQKAFAGCRALASATIGNSVTSIGQYAFQDCSGLTNITYNAVNCTTMSSYFYPVFEGCTSIASLTIGSSVQTIPKYAFYGCTRLAQITSQASVAPTLGENAFTGVTSTIPVNIPCGSIDSYLSGWSCFSNFIDCGAGIAEAEVAAYAIRAVAGGVVIEGAAGREVRLYDIQGRLLRQLRADRDPLQLEVSHGGVYLLQVDNHAAQRVVVL